MLTIALAGNPNAGKSTIFNALTGSHQHVGNWPGKTVEKKEGYFKVDGQDVVLVDLPGAYSLNAFSLEEAIARDFVLHGKPDAVVCVVDSANLERNLYLVVQVMELGVPVVLALNMHDVADRRGIAIDRATLSARLGGVRVISTVGSQGIGLADLRSALVSLQGGQAAKALPPLNLPALNLPALNLPAVLQSHLDELAARLAGDPEFASWPSRWLAAKLLEHDPEVTPLLKQKPDLAAAVAAAQQAVLEVTGEESDILFADARYAFISEVVAAAVRRPEVAQISRSDRIDSIVTHRLWGLPIFLALMWLVFQMTANLSAPLLDFTDALVNTFLGGTLGRALEALSLQDTWFAALLLEGIVAGVGGVLVFIPVLLALYFSIGLLEDSGYMARAAFVMDSLMSRLGLHGKSFLPLLVGFGCTVPAIYATRTLENARDRKITGFVATFMSCGARLPVYVLFGAAFFGARGGTLTFAMYMLGIVVAILTSLAMTHIVFRSKSVAPFVMELPPYRFPSARTVGRSMVERTTSFVRKAGTVIFLASFTIWMLLAIPIKGGGSFAAVEPAESLFGAVSQTIAPAFAPAGFGNWQAAGSLVAGFVAKEVIVSSMAQVYGVSDDDAGQFEKTTFLTSVVDLAHSFVQAILLTLQEAVNLIPRTLNLLPLVNVPEANFANQPADSADTAGLELALAGAFTPAAALAFVAFILLYVPCMSSVAAMKHEFGTRWMLLQVAYTMGVAWCVAVLIFQVGQRAGF